MDIPKQTYRSPLGRLQPDRPDPEDTKRIGWKQHGILVVSPADQRLSWVEQEQLRQIAEKLYGKREARHG